MDPKTETRSFSTLGYYEPAVSRENYHLLTGYQVREVVILNLCATGITLQSRGGNSEITTINANQEVVLAAGAFGSPVLLQRSGVGPKALLESAGIKVKLDLPGVGNNLQDHAASLLLYICKYCVPLNSFYRSRMCQMHQIQYQTPKQRLATPRSLHRSRQSTRRTGLVCWS